MLPVVRDGTIAGGITLGVLAGASALNPVTAPFIGLAAGSAMAYRYFASRKSAEPEKSSQTEQVIEFDKKAIVANIEKHAYPQALALVKANIEKVSLEDIRELLKTMSGLRTKGIWNQTRSEYDTLFNYIKIEEKRLTAASSQPQEEPGKKMEIK